jgi:phosphoribosylanthranilate isomerase
MTWVKICGITILEDALIAVEAGADAVGFVFHEKSPRKVDVETARTIAAELPERVEKVGVFVEQSAEEIREIVRHAGLSAVQWHGDLPSISARETGLRNQSLRKKIWAFPVAELSNELVISTQMAQAGNVFLLDSGRGPMPGGSGKCFDWHEARGIVRWVSRAVPVVIAGGLNEENVTEATRVLEPWGVDVASGVELRPGKKDPAKVSAFVRAVRQADRKAS